MATASEGAAKGQYSFSNNNGLFACTADPGGPALCALTCCCPCFTMGKNAEYAGVWGGYWASCLAPFVPFVGSLFVCYSCYTTNESIAKQNDKTLNFGKCCLTNCCCGSCAACQMRREQLLQGGPGGFMPDDNALNMGTKAPNRKADGAAADEEKAKGDE